MNLFGEHEGATDDAETIADLEVDLTPTGAALAFGLMLDRVVTIESGSARILDPSAGSGIFGRVARVLRPKALINGIEPRESERPGLGSIYDNVQTRTLEEAISRIGGPMPHNLVLSNPPFSVAFGGEKPWPLLLRESRWLSPTGVVALLGRSDFGQSEEAWSLLKAWSPVAAIRCGGRLGFRAEGEETMRPIPKARRKPGGPTHEPRKNGGDNRDHTLWVWSMRHQPSEPTWTTYQMPPLPAAWRKWRRGAVPGTYALDDVLVKQVRELVEAGRA
jgi:hypothetical protein